MKDTSTWRETVKKKVSYMTNQIWDGITHTDVDGFISNFEPDNSDVGWALLDMLIYFSSEQEESIISNLMRLLKRDLWLMESMKKADMSSGKIFSMLDDKFSQMCFIPVEESDITASSFVLTSQFKKSSEVPETVEYIKVEDIPLKIAMQKKYFVFYDDIIGTGTQFKTFWEKKVFGDVSGDNKKMFSLQEVFNNNPNIHVYYIVLGGCQDGIEYIERHIPSLTVIASERFSKGADIFSEDNEYWEVFPKKRESVLNYIEAKEKELCINNKFGKNIPVLFQHGRASNTAISLYWTSNKKGWTALYKR